MIEEEIEIRTADGTTDGVFYRPDAERRWPGVIHLTDIGGIRPSHRDMARRLSAEGYAVIMPNVFYRISKPPVFAVDRSNDELVKKRIAELTTPLTPEAVERDASAYVDVLRSHDSVSADRPMGVVGYCYSGGVAMRIAAALPDRIAAVASFHGGGLFTDAPTSPHLLLPRIRARLYFGHATKDRSMPDDAIQKFNHALESWGGRYESEVYEGSYHSWTVPDSPVYKQQQAERALMKLSDLFHETLG